MKKRIFHIILFLFLRLGVNAQELLPFVENFTKSDYTGDNQVWSNCQGKDNAIYFANNHNFLRYNGVKWEKYLLPNKTIIRSVYADEDRVYSGSYNEFGYWKRIEGKMVYFSISKGKNLFVGESINEEIWKIFKFNGKIYFQSFNELFIYNQNKIQKIRIPFLISYCFPIGDKLYVASVNKGVYLFEKNKFYKIENWNLLENNIIHSIDINKGKTYIFTKKNGVFVDNNGILSSWNNSLNDHFKSELIIAARFINDEKLAIGTASRGLYIINLNDNSFVNVNRNNSLLNNSVLSIGFDKENDLWLGLDNGISHIEINSPYSIFSDNTGVLGSVYTVAPSGDGFLLGSNHGVFNYKNKKLDLIQGTQGHVWDISPIESKFLIGHNDGTFLLDNLKLFKVNPVCGGWKLLKSNFGDIYFQANYSGIVMYKGSNFKDYKYIKGFTKPIKNIAQNRKDELWAVDNYKSLYRIKFTPNYDVLSIENVTKSNGILNDYDVKLFSFKNEILFFIHNNWYNFNAISNKLEINPIFNKSFKNITEVIPVDENSFLILKEGLFYVVSQIDNRFVWDLIPEKYYRGKVINQDTKVFKQDDKLIINLDDGFLTFIQKESNVKKQNIIIEGFYEGNVINKDSNIKHNQSIELNVIAPYYGFNRPNLFYKLNRSSDFITINKGNIVLNNLNSGDQEIKVYFHNGNEFTEIANYSFYVARPWYFSIGVIFLYIVLISGIFFLYYRWNKIRYTEKLKLKDEELKHQKAILQLELDAENKLKIQEYEKHILEIQVQTKASEVAGKSLSIAKQSEMIESIQKLLEKENDIANLKSNIKKTIKLNSINKKEWETFENNLFKSHEDFIKRLSSKYPKLSSKDIKLCIYLKMSLSSKEIAPLMNISFRGVELHRYRLRKKLEINQETNLSNFMNNI